MDEVEKLLLAWIKEKELDGDGISDGIICEKALRIYADLQNQTPSTSVEGGSGFTFKTSRGWFEKFKHRSGIHGLLGIDRRTDQARKKQKSMFANSVTP